MKPWHVLSNTVLLDCSPWLRVFREHVRLPNGVELPDYYRIEMPDWAQVFAITEDGHVPMVRHYKHGPRETSLELPAGYIDPGESPAEAARRELLEETGLVADEWRSLGEYFVDGNRGCGATHIFLARGARQVSAPHLEASEVMEQQLLSLDEVRAAWLGGTFRNAGTLGAVGLALAVLESDR